MPGVEPSLPAYLFDLFCRNADRTLYIEARTGEAFTYGRLLHESRVMASFLEQKGVTHGSAVAFSMDNCQELITLYFACLHLGARVVPINPNYHPRDFAAIFDSIPARLFFVSPNVRASLANMPAPRACPEIVCFKPQVEECKQSRLGTINFDFHAELGRHQPATQTFASMANDAIAFTMYTSGSTGCPKGVNMRLGNLLGNGLAFCRRLGLDRDSRFCNILALTYLGGVYNLMLIPILAEGSFVLDGVFGPTNVFGFWELVQTHQVNTLWFSPTMLSMLLMLEDDTDLSLLKSQIRTAICGMAPLPINLKERFEQRFGFRLLENYGLSETTFLTTSAPGLAHKPGSVGLPLEHVNIAIVDNERRPLPAGREGQIAVQTPYLMAGYENEEPIEQTLARNGGFFLTGDLGHLDTEGELFITGRVKDLIIRGGVNISPKGIEDVIYRLDSVQEAAVVGVPHAIYGEEVALVLKLREPYRNRVTTDDVQRFCEGNIAHFQRPKFIFFIDEIPKGATGKIQKNAIRRMLQERLDPLNG